MKKSIIGALICAMALSVGTLSAFAAPDDTMTATGNRDIDVKAVYNDEVNIPTVYNVDLEWGAMEFTYTATGVKDMGSRSKTVRH